MATTVQVLVPHTQGLYGDALATALGAVPGVDVAAASLVEPTTDPTGVEWPRADLFLVAAATARGESIRLAHHLQVTTGAPVVIFDAPDRPVFAMAAVAAGVALVVPVTASWDAFRLGVHGQLFQRRVTTVGAGVPRTRSPWHNQRRHLVEALGTLPATDRTVLAMALRGVSRATISARTGSSRADTDRSVSRGLAVLGVASTSRGLEAVLRHGLFETFGLHGKV